MALVTWPPCDHTWVIPDQKVLELEWALSHSPCTPANRGADQNLVPEPSSQMEAGQSRSGSPQLCLLIVRKCGYRETRTNISDTFKQFHIRYKIHTDVLEVETDIKNTQGKTKFNKLLRQFPPQHESLKLREARRKKMWFSNLFS